MNALWEILQGRMVRRGVPTKNLTPGDHRTRGQRHGSPRRHPAAGHSDRGREGTSSSSSRTTSSRKSRPLSRPTRSGCPRRRRTNCRKPCAGCASMISASRSSSATIGAEEGSHEGTIPGRIIPAIVPSHCGCRSLRCSRHRQATGPSQPIRRRRPSRVKPVLRDATAVNADAKAVAGFLDRINEYVALHKKLENTLPKLSKESTPEQIDRHQRALGTARSRTRGRTRNRETCSRRSRKSCSSGCLGGCSVARMAPR